MPNPYFQFKQFTIHQDRAAMKVTTDSCFFGAWAAEEMKTEKSRIKNAIDVGCGTGVLSLMIAQKNNVAIDAIEIDEEAAAQARENIEQSPWNKKIRVIHQDILDFDSENKYEVIISNPPFYENELNSSNEKKNTAHHSSELTMSGLTNSIQKLLSEDGIFFLMYPFKREKEIQSFLEEKQLFIQKRIYLKQSFSHQPFRILLKGSTKKVQTETLELSIWNESQQYTAEFVGLLKDYYLYL